MIVTYHSRKTCDSTDVFILRFGEAGEAVLQASLSPGDVSRDCRIFEFRTEVQTGHGLPLVGRQDLKELSNRTLQKIFCFKSVPNRNLQFHAMSSSYCDLLKGMVFGDFEDRSELQEAFKASLEATVVIAEPLKILDVSIYPCVTMIYPTDDLSIVSDCFPSRPMVKAPWHGA